MNLQFGFESHAYSQIGSFASPLPQSVKRRLAKRPSPAQIGYGQGKSSSQVAIELETRYRIVETFYNLEEDNLIIPLLADDYRDLLDAQMSGLQTVATVTTRTTDKIEQRFRRNLTGRRYDGVIRGVPTRTSQRGISHLRLKPSAARGSRPSFVNTGLYMRSFKAWEE
jgi:hypothetical protein